MKALINLVERGLVPDGLTRAGIRNLLRQRLRAENAGNCEAQLDRRRVYPYVSEGPSDWMAEHFFTGGIMPSDDLPYAFQEHLVVDDHWRVNGRHYSRTLEAWLQQMDNRRNQLMPLFREVYGEHAERWFERWRIFFLACSELFAFRGGNEWWVSHYRLRAAGAAATATLNDRTPQLFAVGE